MIWYNKKLIPRTLETKPNDTNVNLTLVWHTHENGVCFPVLVNKQKIAKGDALVRTGVGHKQTSR